MSVIQCLVCNSRMGNSNRNAVGIFGVGPSLHTSKIFPDILADIIEVPINQAAHSKVLCKQCYKACLEYDEIKARMSEIKSQLVFEFKTTLSKHKINYEKYPEKISNENKPKKKEIKKLVLPASKLKPLPPNYLVVNKLDNTIVFNKPVPKIDLKKTTKIAISPVKSASQIAIAPQNTTATESGPIITLDATINDQSVASILNSKSTITLENLVKTLPKDLNNVGENSGNSQEKAHDEMEIDEECTHSIFSQDGKDKTIEVQESVNKATPDQSNLFDLLGNQVNENDSDGDQKYVIGKVEILEQDGNSMDDNDHTILMEGEDGSVIRVITKQFVYDDEQSNNILIVPDEESRDNDSNDEESQQIELQVSGDEATANAIIEATRNEGGTYIKVGSGETYEINSVESRVRPPVDVLKSIVERDGENYVCVICAQKAKENNCVENFEFITTDSNVMLNHIKVDHGTRIYICAECGLVIRKKSEFSKHLETHGHNSQANANKKYECVVCKKKCGSKALLSEHMNKHSGTRPYQCTICEKTFASKYTYAAHLKIHMDRPRLFKCSKCTKSFFTQQNLTQHEKTHSNAREFECKICGKGFISQHNLEVHAVVHSGIRAFECGVCGKCFARKAEIHDHMRTHTGEKPFQCDICSVSFAQRSNLQSHKRHTHLHDKRHACQYCDKKFKRRRLLDYHVKSSHTGERPYQCELCRATFVYPEHYKKHMRIHTGEKPYECEVCGKTFNSRDNRNTHRFVHSDKKPYECLVCSAGFMRKMQLYAHMNTCGHLSESIVVNQPRLHHEEDILTEQNTQLKPDWTVDSASTTLECTEKLATDSASLLKLLVDDTQSQSDGEAKITIVNQDANSEHLIQEPDVNTIITSADGQTFNIEESQLSGAGVRLVPVSLSGGRRGWLALN